MIHKFDRELRHDGYYMGLAEQVKTGANCLGSKIGAVIVLDNRVLSTGYNGTPDGFKKCLEYGCVRCKDSSLEKEGKIDEMSDPTHIGGAALDRCVCVHAEQNAFLAAARFGVSINKATLYTTLSPCFNCLKEAIQVGINRIVFGNLYEWKLNDELKEQYKNLHEHLSAGDRNNFMKFEGEQKEIVGVTS